MPQLFCRLPRWSLRIGSKQRLRGRGCRTRIGQAHPFLMFRSDPLYPATICPQIAVTDAGRGSHLDQVQWGIREKLHVVDKSAPSGGGFKSHVPGGFAHEPGPGFGERRCAAVGPSLFHPAFGLDRCDGVDVVLSLAGDSIGRFRAGGELPVLDSQGWSLSPGGPSPQDEEDEGWSKPA